MPIINHFGDVKTRGNLTVLGVFSNFSGNVFASNAVSTTNVIATGNVSAANLVSSGNLWAGSNVNSVNVWSTGNVSAANLVSSGNLWAGSNINSVNVWATGNVSAANLVSSGNVWAGSNVNSVNVWATGNVSAANLVSSGNLWAASNLNSTNVWSTGNVSAANLVSSGNVWAGTTSNVNSKNVWATANISGVTLNTTNLLVAGTAGTTNQVLQATGTAGGVQWGTISALSGLTTGAVLYATSATSASTTGTASNFYWDNTNARLGLGTAVPGYPLHVTATGVATASSAYSNLAFQTGGWYQAYNAAGTRTLKIYTDGNIGCAELDLFSDQRIKKDIEDVSEAEAALLVSELRPRTFRYTDTIEYGPERVNGLIAQEVLRVVPSAVSTHEGVVPDVFKSGKVSGDWIAVEGAFAPGDVLKVLDGDEIHMVSVVDVRGDGSVRVDKELKGAEVFVYGHEVQDFHTVSYERIVPLLISTIQSLQKRVAILENKSQ